MDMQPNESDGENENLQKTRILKMAIPAGLEPAT